MSDWKSLSAVSETHLAGGHVVEVELGLTDDDRFAVHVKGRDVDWHSLWYAPAVTEEIVRTAVADWLESYNEQAAKEQRPS